MKRLLVPVLLIAVLCTAITGCCLFQSKEKVLADGIEATLQQVLVEYEAIVIEGEPRPPYNNDDKEIRRESLKKYRQLLTTARE